MELKFKVLDGGTLPTRAHREDAGFDLYSPNDITLRENEYRTIDLKVCVEIPKGYVGFIMGRSSLNIAGVLCFNGVIDSGYTGEIAVTLMNFSTRNCVGYNKVYVNKGARIAQLVVCKIADIDDAVTVDKLDDTERGDGGFGSTGV